MGSRVLFSFVSLNLLCQCQEGAGKYLFLKRQQSDKIASNDKTVWRVRQVGIQGGAAVHCNLQCLRHWDVSQAKEQTNIPGEQKSDSMQPEFGSYSGWEWQLARIPCWSLLRRSSVRVQSRLWKENDRGVTNCEEGVWLRNMHPSDLWQKRKSPNTDSFLIFMASDSLTSVHSVLHQRQRPRNLDCIV